MLKEYPVKINGISIIQASSWQEDRGVIEHIYQTEAGTDQISVTRYDKMQIKASYRCRDTWYARFLTFSLEDSLLVEMFDPIQKGYMSRTMRMRDFQSKLIENSEHLQGTNGIWDVSFSLEEF